MRRATAKRDRRDPSQYQIGTGRTLDILTREELITALMDSMDCIADIGGHVADACERVEAWSNDRKPTKAERPKMRPRTKTAKGDAR